MSQPIRDLGGHLGFSIGLKNTIVIEDVDIMLLDDRALIPVPSDCYSGLLQPLDLSSRTDYA